MSKEKSISYCKDELTLLVPDGKGEKFRHIDRIHIKEIKIEKCTMKKLLKQIPTEKIEISLANMELPIIYYRENEKHYFDEYKTLVSSFAKENRVKFFDTTTA